MERSEEPNSIPQISNGLNTQIPYQNNVAAKVRSVLLGALLIGGAVLNKGCATTNNSQTKTPTGKSYIYNKPQEIKVVKRQINFCASKKKDLEAEAARCKTKPNYTTDGSLKCVTCTTEVEVTTN